MQNDWLDTLVSSIARQEGFFAGDQKLTPVVRNNPGDLRYAHQRNATSPDGTTEGMQNPEPIAVFSSLEAGIAALYRDVLAKIATGASLKEVIYVFAPPNENNSATYLANVAAWTGTTDINAPLIRRFAITKPAA